LTTAAGRHTVNTPFTPSKGSAMTTTPTIGRLDVDTINTQPVSADWSELGYDYDETGTGFQFWDIELPDDGEETECGECRRELVAVDGEWIHADEHYSWTEASAKWQIEHGEKSARTESANRFLEDDYEDSPDHAPDASEWDDEHRGEGPMMNYWYPLHTTSRDFDPADAARTLAKHSLPLCVVSVNDEHGLALTGGGMDFSWEICEAFARLGYCPPLHFCDLPRMAGRENYDSTPFVLAACAYSARIAAQWAARSVERVEQLAADYGVTLEGEK
jgi:hypothetical protein